MKPTTRILLPNPDGGFSVLELPTRAVVMSLLNDATAPEYVARNWPSRIEQLEPPPGQRAMRDGTTRIAEERQRQRKAEGYTDAHDDDENADGSLAQAAGCYAFAAASTRVYQQEGFAASVHFSDPWPWEQRYDARPYDGNVLRDATDAEAILLLEKAGALIAAEIDRLLRASTWGVWCTPLAENAKAAYGEAARWLHEDSGPRGSAYDGPFTSREEAQARVDMVEKNESWRFEAKRLPIDKRGGHG